MHDVARNNAKTKTRFSQDFTSTLSTCLSTCRSSTCSIPIGETILLLGTLAL